MTKAKPLPEILPGPDGRRGKLRHCTNCFYVSTRRKIKGMSWDSWCGPMFKTEEGAIRNWNRVMGVYWAAKLISKES